MMPSDGQYYVPASGMSQQQLLLWQQQQQQQQQQAANSYPHQLHR
jgi:hypothetical protein